ncbi:MAG: hypothetical protein WCI11_14375 [Candidatus Methylumidiphilus sp.]
MKTLRIYVDTSVIGGCFDEEFQPWSELLIDDFRQGRYTAVVSDVTATEIAPAPEFVQTLHKELIGFPSEVIHVDDEVVSLVDAYLNRNILSQRYFNDMLHIALATIADVDVLVSWNFKHIVRLDKIRQFNAVNLEQGYKTLSIYSPREVISHAQED